MQPRISELTKRLTLHELLEYQDELIRRDQAMAAGITRTAIDGHVRRGRWSRMFPAVYLTQQRSLSAPVHRRLLIRAAWMWAGDDAVIFGSAAAFWAGYLPDRPGPVGVIVPPHRRLSARPAVRVIRATLDQRDTRVEDGIVITGAFRTAVDLATEGCNDLLHRMAQGNWLQPVKLQQALERGAGRRGWSAARVAVHESLENPHSEAERLTHRALLAGGVTGWRANPDLVVFGHTMRPDIVFDDVKLIVEIDGYAYHSDRDAFERDRYRQNILTAAGWTVLRFTWRQVRDDPAAVVTQIKATRSMLQTQQEIG